MIIKEEANNLFAMPEEYYLAQCISSDFVMGAGIAVLFNKYFNMKNILLKNFPTNLWNGKGFCIKYDRVLNLISKRYVFQKPSYKSLEESLLSMKEIMKKCDIHKVAIPLIGCGIDGLIWQNVKKVLEETFSDYEGEIIVCYLKEEEWRLSL